MSGIKLIEKERKEQIEKHGYSLENDKALNCHEQLSLVASILCLPDALGCGNIEVPFGWDKEVFNKMINKPYEERLVIAGALIAAEIDRLEI